MISWGQLSLQISLCSIFFVSKSLCASYFILEGDIPLWPILENVPMMTQFFCSFRVIAINHDKMSWRLDCSYSFIPCPLFCCWHKRMIYKQCCLRTNNHFLSLIFTILLGSANRNHLCGPYETCVWRSMFMRNFMAMMVLLF